MKNEQLFGVIRHILTFGAGFLVSKGVLDPTSVETLVGAVMTLGGFAWSFWEKRSKD